MGVEGGALARVTGEPGRVEAYAASPDESMLAVVHSYTNRPPELFLMETRRRAR